MMRMKGRWTSLVYCYWKPYTAYHFPVFLPVVMGSQRHHLDNKHHASCRAARTTCTLPTCECRRRALEWWRPAFRIPNAKHFHRFMLHRFNRSQPPGNRLVTTEPPAAVTASGRRGSLTIRALPVQREISRRNDRSPLCRWNCLDC